MSENKLNISLSLTEQQGNMLIEASKRIDRGPRETLSRAVTLGLQQLMAVEKDQWKDYWRLGGSK